MNKLSPAKRIQVVHALCEGCSLRATARMAGVGRGTVARLLKSLGEVCSAFLDDAVTGLTCQRIQADEIWSFVGCKEKAKAKGAQGEGSVWTWTAIDADTKLVLSWAVGPRDAGTAWDFMNDVAGRLVNRVQLTTDGLGVYLEAVADNFGPMVDYGQLIKLYGDDPRAKRKDADGRYSPGQCVGCKPYARIGDPDPKHISTSYVERHNLTIRMQNRRFTRLTNAFSKSLEYHAHQQAIYFVWYNFVKPHKTLNGATPAMAAGLAKDWWEVSDMIALLDAKEQQDIADGTLKRGQYKPRRQS